VGKHKNKPTKDEPAEKSKKLGKHKRNQQKIANFLPSKGSNKSTKKRLAKRDTAVMLNRAFKTKLPTTT
jgi:hypothetical protein